MAVLRAHICQLLGGVCIPYLDRDPEAEPLHLVEGAVNSWTDQIHHLLEEVHKVCDRVLVGLQPHILDQSIGCHLPVELGARDVVIWARGGCCGVGAVGDGWLSGVGR